MRGARVAITGMGAISAAGDTCEATLATLRSGQRRPGLVSVVDSPIAKPVFEVPSSRLTSRQECMRSLRLALCAVEEAMRNARLVGVGGEARVGVCLGTTVASQLNDLDFYRAYREGGKASTDAVDRYLQGNLAEAVAREFSLSGPTLTVANACSSGTDAVGIAMTWLEADACDIVIAGGADEMNRVPLAGFHSLGILSDEPCAPFDRNRSGLNLGEGAGAVVLEGFDSAARRGASVDLTCLGYGTCCDAYHVTAPRPDGSGLESAIRAALSGAGVAPGDVAFVNAHGTATRDNDRVEGAVLARVFGKACRVYSSKGYTGHTLGAAGALEAVFAAMGLRHGWIPASVGFTEQDPDIPLSPVREVTEIEGRCALSTSLAFGGNNSALVFGRA